MNKTIENFTKESIRFNKKGEHYEYFKSFFDEIFYNQKEPKIRESIEDFLSKTDTRNLARSSLPVFDD